MNKRYWLKGGTWGLSFTIILLLVALSYVSSELCGVNSAGPNIDCGYIEHIKFVGGAFLETIIEVLVLGGAIIGTFFGWIYGKIKNKKKE